MSFILDALKKSESDRQRASGPALFEVKVARSRSALPAWGIVLGALLGVNVLILAWMLLRHPAARIPDTSVPAGTAPQALAAAAAAAPGPASPTTPASPATTATATPAPGATPPAPLTAPAAAAPPAAAAGENPEDYAPATEPPAPALGSHVRRGTADGVPLYQEAVGAPGAHIPQLRLDLHAYAERPQDRFVMINMHRLREGESLPEGVHVDGITPEGALLSYRGVRFLLPRE